MGHDHLDHARKLATCPSMFSCCVTVKNIERCLYFLPREKQLDRSGQPTDEDVTFEGLYKVSSHHIPAALEV